MLAFMYCLNLKIRWTQLAVISILIQNIMTHVNICIKIDSTGIHFQFILIRSST